MKNIYLAFFFILYSLNIFGQVQGIGGRVMDSTNAKGIAFASVALIRQQDSILIKYSRTDQYGRFELKPINNGNYILLIGHSNYIDFFDNLTVSDSNSIADLGEINLIHRGQQLREVIITNKAGIKIKGDTLEYFETTGNKSPVRLSLSRVMLLFGFG